MSIKNYYPQGAPGRQIVKRKRVNEDMELEPGKPWLFDQVRDKIRAKHYSIRTEKTYLR
jgi:hypothetical protein